jgi:hypothetical protein
MLFCDLLRLTVLLVGAMATALGAVAVVAANQQDDTLILIVAAAWWVVAVALGLYLGRPERAAESMSRVLAGARVSPTLPQQSSLRTALIRLWPLGAFALVAGGLAWMWPQVPAIGAGYAILVALAWRNREAVVTGVEDRDGVRFYVEPSSAFEPVRLVRTPGLSRDRMPAGHPPPPPPAETEPEPVEPSPG